MVFLMKLQKVKGYYLTIRMRKLFCFLLLFVSFFSCTTSNTIYEKPENIIPKDTMELLLKDLYIANSSKNIKNKTYKKKKNYLPIVYEKYKIDSTRFFSSNNYYTSRIEEYNDILANVKSSLEKKLAIYESATELKMSSKKEKKEKTKLKNLKKRTRRLGPIIEKIQKDIDTIKFYNIPYLFPKVKEYDPIFNKRG